MNFARIRRRALGQHFLADVGIARTIVEHAVAEGFKAHCEAFLEIGPGRGALTEHLIRLLMDQNHVPLTLCEKDPQLVQAWQPRSAELPGLEVLAGDFLEQTPAAWLQRTPLCVVANLPYSAATAILDQLSRSIIFIPVMVLMFQKEVGVRLLAEAPSSRRGSLSVWMQNLWEIESLIEVPPRAFTPSPQVESVVLGFRRRSIPQRGEQLGPEAEALWEKMLKTSFLHKRKMLRSSFPWKQALELSGVDPTRRPEALEWAEWRALFAQVQKSS